MSNLQEHLLSNELLHGVRCHDSGGCHATESQGKVKDFGCVIKDDSHPSIDNGDVILLSVCLFVAAEILVLPKNIPLNNELF